jgi:hypothetical protein
MNKEVVGVYEKEPEVVEAVEHLKDQGYEPEEISIVANNSEETSWIRSQTEVSADNSVDQKSEPGFMDKVKAVFKGQNPKSEDAGSYTDRLKSFGISEEQAAQYNEDVKNGKIVVLAPETAEGVGNVTDTTASSSDAPNRADNPEARNVGTPPHAEGTRRAGDPLKDDKKDPQ